MRLRAVLCVVVALTSAACSSTVSPPEPRATPATPATEPAGTSAPAAARDGVSPATQRRSPAAGPARTTSPGAASRRVVLGPGITAREIAVGFAHVQGANEAFAAFGAGAVQLPDQRGYARVIVDHVNARGGIAGRKIRPVSYEYKASAAGDTQSEHQAACAKFAEDDRVFIATGVILASGSSDDLLVPCLARHGVIWVGGTGGDEQWWRRYAKYQYSSFDLNATRGYRTFVDGLVRQKYFRADSRVGVVYFDNPASKRAAMQGLVGAMRARGIKVASTGATSADTSYFSDMPGIVLRFRQDGVTNVLFAAPGGGAAWQFMSNAQSQGWKPKYGYGISTADSPGAALELLAPESQLRGAVGIGYNVPLDVGDAQLPPSTPAQRSCEKIFEDAGMKPSSALEKGLAWGSCDFVRLLRRALGGTVLTVDGFERAVDAIGASFEPNLALATRFRPGPHDGGAGYRDLFFDAACSCFGYRGPVRPTR